MKIQAEDLIYKLYDYYNVSTISALAQKMNIGQPSISKWKSCNSINAIKKKCRELGIYKEIFKNTDCSQVVFEQIKVKDNEDLLLYEQYVKLEGLAKLTSRGIEGLNKSLEILKDEFKKAI
jgi:hypothetical protein